MDPPTSNHLNDNSRNEESRYAVDQSAEIAEQTMVTMQTETNEGDESGRNRNEAGVKATGLDGHEAK